MFHTVLQRPAKNTYTTLCTLIPIQPCCKNMPPYIKTCNYKVCVVNILALSSLKNFSSFGIFITICIKYSIRKISILVSTIGYLDYSSIKIHAH